jgi:hypothetical protein
MRMWRGSLSGLRRAAAGWGVSLHRLPTNQWLGILYICRLASIRLSFRCACCDIQGAILLPTLRKPSVLADAGRGRNHGRVA